MKEKIAIMTDSTCDIPEGIVKEYDLRVVPLRILFKDGEYRDQTEISSAEVYRRLPREMPSTSLPFPGDVWAVFEELKSQGFTHVVAIHISSGLSGTVQLIENLSRQVKGLVVEVIDSKNISMGLGYTVIEAARKLREKANFQEICRHVLQSLRQMRVYFVLETLEYLKKGGRIGKVAGTLGQILNLKPIITVNEEGIYTTYAKVRGRRQSVEKLLEIVRMQVAESLHNVAICHGAAKKEAQGLLESIKTFSNVAEIITGHVSPVIGVHTGPGTLGVVVYQVD